MDRGPRLPFLAALGFFASYALGLPAPAGADSREPLKLSEAIGEEIDAAERERYSLFPELRNFTSGRFFREDGRVVLEYGTGRAGDERRARRTISDEAFEETQRHVALVESYVNLRDESEAESLEQEARIVRRMALRYALDTRYDLALALIDDFSARHPEEASQLGLGAMTPELRRLAESKRVLFREGALLDRSGRTDLLIFAGYYGVWLGIGTPVALDADAPGEYALGLLTIPPLALATAHFATRNRGFTDADAMLVTLGGHFGTWQGIGWANVADMERNEDVVGAGILAGLGGIGTSVLLVHAADLRDGHTSLMDAGMYWGAGLGLLAGVWSDQDDDDLLTAALIGSDAGVVAAGLFGKDTTLTPRRIRLANLGGVVGGILGAGVLLLAETEDEKAAAGIIAVGSVSGAAAALHWTKD